MLLRVVRHPREYGSQDILRHLSETIAESPWSVEREQALPIPINVKEHSDRYELFAELPGVTREDLRISIEARAITIKAERKPTVSGASAKLVHSEIPTGAFSRTFVVPKDVEAGKLEARLSDGILRLTMPKSEHSLPREITIQ